MAEAHVSLAAFNPPLKGTLWHPCKPGPNPVKPVKNEMVRIFGMRSINTDCTWLLCSRITDNKTPFWVSMDRVEVESS